MSYIYTCDRGGAGFILHQGRQGIWETTTIVEMVDYLRDQGITRDTVRFLRPTVLVILGEMP